MLVNGTDQREVLPRIQEMSGSNSD